MDEKLLKKAIRAAKVEKRFDLKMFMIRFKLDKADALKLLMATVNELEKDGRLLLNDDNVWMVQ